MTQNCMDSYVDFYLLSRHGIRFPRLMEWNDIFSRFSRGMEMERTSRPLITYLLWVEYVVEYMGDIVGVPECQIPA